MSYARFGWDGSDVYVFRSNLGLECCGCLLQQREWVRDKSRVIGGYLKAVGEIVPHTFDTPAEMLTHLDLHREKGHTVPQDCIDQLRSER